MSPKTTNRYPFRFFRAGQVDQVALASGEDLAHLEELDQKLWLALACPTQGVEFPARTLELLDTDKDGRIRVPEVLEAVRFARDVFKDLDDLFKADGTLPLSAIGEHTKAGKDLLAGAKRLLENLGKTESTAVTLEDVADTAKIFAATKFNGDGVVPADSAEDDATRAVIDDIIKTHGSLPDRSGKPGVDKALTEKFFTDAKGYAEWLAKGDAEPSPRVLGEATAPAEAALRAVRDKVDDYFMRCRMASFDPRAGALLNPTEDALSSIGRMNLNMAPDAMAALPLSHVQPARPLSLVEGLNPAFKGAMAAFAKDTVEPLLGAGKASLSESEWATLKDRLAPYASWIDAKPATLLEGLGQPRIRELASGTRQAAVLELIAKDADLAAESDQIETIEKAILYRRDLVQLLRNFVNFAEFYRGKAIFQAGTLFLDGRACDLCLHVENVGRHAALAGLAKVYLVYCDCTRKNGEKRGIVAAFTGGDTDNLLVGRNGVFYDRQGKDWDATITKIIENPISIRQAIWSPYKSFVRMIEAQVAKRAATADQEARAKVESTATAAANVDKTPRDPNPKKPEPKKMDIGTVAAIGVAVGGLATFLSSIFATFFGLGMWMPLGLLALILAISGPSMLIAWLKLRQRNIGPILDANGWAVNALAKINVPFGESLTQVASLPQGARRGRRDPFAVKRPAYFRYFLLLLLIAAGVYWGMGKLDRHLPTWMQKDTVFQRFST